MHKSGKHDREQRQIREIKSAEKFKRNKAEKTIKTKMKHYCEQKILKCNGDSEQNYKFINTLINQQGRYF